MSRFAVAARILAALVATGLPAALGADSAGGPDPGVAALEEFLGRSRPLCPVVPAERCVDMAWRYADRNGDRQLSTDELAAVRREVEAWSLWKGEALTKADQASIALGLWLIDSIGLERLLERYDVDGRPGVSRAELLADVKLDRRPLPEILRDPQALDREAMSRRLAQLSPLIDGLLRQPR